MTAQKGSLVLLKVGDGTTYSLTLSSAGQVTFVTA